MAAHILPRPGAHLTPDAVRDALSRQLANYKVPAHIEIVHSLPRDDSGKVYKQQIRNRYAAEVSVESGAGVQ